MYYSQSFLVLGPGRGRGEGRLFVLFCLQILVLTDQIRQYPQHTGEHACPLP